MEDPNQGYKDEENEQKAKEVRELIKLAYKAKSKENIERYRSLLDSAEIISGELLEYLEDTSWKYHPQKPEIELFNYPYSDTIFALVNRLGNRSLEWFKNHTSISASLKDFEENNLHWIGIIYTQEDEESDPLILYTLFVDEEGLHMERQINNLNTRFLMPKEFYSFLQRMGLTLNQAASLYNIDASGSYGEEWMGFPQEFEQRSDSWPLVVEKGKKL